MKGLLSACQVWFVVGWQGWPKAEHLGSEGRYDSFVYLSDVLRYLGQPAGHWHSAGAPTLQLDVHSNTHVLFLHPESQMMCQMKPDYALVVDQE